MNAKELILKKINADANWVDIYCSGLILGESLKSISDLMMDPDIVAVCNRYVSSVFDDKQNYDKKLFLLEEIEKAKDEEVIKKYQELLRRVKISEELQFLGKMLKINQGIPTKTTDLYSYIKSIEKYVESVINSSLYDQYLEMTAALEAEKLNWWTPELQELLDSKKVSIFDVASSEYKEILNSRKEFVTNILKPNWNKFNLIEFIKNPNYRSSLTYDYEENKRVFNILDIINSVPHFSKMFSTIALNKDILNILSVRNAIENTILDQLDKNYDTSSSNPTKKLSNKEVDNIKRKINKMLIRKWINSKNLRYGTVIQPSTNENYYIDSLRSHIENIAIPMLKDALPNNIFIQSLTLGVKYEEDDNGKSSKKVFWKLPFNMTQIDNNPKTLRAYEDCLRSFNDLRYVKINGLSINPVDLFYIYNLIVNDDKFGVNSLTRIFEDIIASPDSANLLLYEYNTWIDQQNVNALSNEFLSKLLKSNKKGKVQLWQETTDKRNQAYEAAVKNGMHVVSSVKEIEIENEPVMQQSNKSNQQSLAEIWSKKEGWSVEYFNTRVKPRLNEAWQFEYKLSDDQESPVQFEGEMKFSYNGKQRGDIHAKTTLEAIKLGERTATTRYESDKHIDYWKNAKVGDRIKFKLRNIKTIDITDKNEYSFLNNSAERPFVFGQKSFKNVKDAVQEWKTTVDNELGNIPNRIAIDNIMIQMFIEKSFEQNPEYLKKLLATGNAILTYNQAKNQLDAMLPEFLMEIRERLGGLKPQKQEYIIVEVTKPLTKLVPTKEEIIAKNKAEKTRTETLEVLGGVDDPIANSEFSDAIKVAKKGISFDEAIKGVNPIFTDIEITQIKQALNGKNLKVMSVSRQTDPIFFANDIVKFLEENSKKPFTDPTRVNAIEIWTKHDGLPLKQVLEACKKYKVAPMVSFSITGLGGTALEQGVLKYNDLINLIEKLVQDKILNPITTTIRIDPILVGETNFDDIRTIVERCKKIGMKKFVTSLVQSYGYLDGVKNRDRHVISGINKFLAEEDRTYDWDKYYGRITQEDLNVSGKFVKEYLKEHPKALWGEITSAAAKNRIRTVTKSSIGKIHFIPKFEYIDQIGSLLIELNRDPNIEIETCSFYIKGLKQSACLDPLIIERVTGVDVTRADGTYDRDTSRPDCMCYAAHGGSFDWGFNWDGRSCNSSCAYCYAGHSSDNNVKYYDENGNLLHNAFTDPYYKLKYTITYTPKNKKTQTYTIIGDHIYNQKGDEIFKTNSVDRIKILTNLAVKLGHAKVIEHKGNKYVVYDDGKIVSVKTGKIMQWTSENGNRKAILELAKNTNISSNNEEELKFDELESTPEQLELFTDYYDTKPSKESELISKIKIANIKGLYTVYNSDFELDPKYIELAEKNPYIKSAKGFVLNGEIYINVNKATDDTIIHEFSHLYLADAKLKHSDEYYQLLSQVRKTSTWKSLRDRPEYKNKQGSDFDEEVLATIIDKYYKNYNENSGDSFIEDIEDEIAIQILDLVSPEFKDLLLKNTLPVLGDAFITNYALNQRSATIKRKLFDRKDIEWKCYD